MDQPKLESGRARRERAQGEASARLQDRLAGLDSGLAEWADGFIFGDVWARPGLTHEERMLIAISALAVGGHTHMLRNYLHGALQDGIEPIRIHESLVMLCVYAGFPAAIMALWEWRQVLDKEHRAGRVSDEEMERVS